MLLHTNFVLAWLALAVSVVSGRLHLATGGLLQIHPSFVGEGITLLPGHHPEHDIDHMDHLVPQHEHRLYYAQEGHRPAVHGAKHGSLNAKFVRPTIVLDHTSHLKRVHCGVRNQMELCFTADDAFQHAQKAWNMSEFNIVTFHLGCGDEYSGQRSYFHARRPTKIDLKSRCITIPTKQIEHTDALESGEITWGVYRDPKLSKRVPVMGHVKLTDQPGERARAKREEATVLRKRADDPESQDANPDDQPDPSDDSSSTDADQPDQTAGDGDPSEPDAPADGDEGNGDGGDGNLSQFFFPGDEPPTQEEVDQAMEDMKNATMDDEGLKHYDLDDDAAELAYFFGEDMGFQPKPVPEDETLPFLGDDYSLPDEDVPGSDDPTNTGDSGDGTETGDDTAATRRSSSRRSPTAPRYRPNAVSSREVSTYLEKRSNVFSFLINFINQIVSLIRTFAEIAATVAKVLVQVAIVSAKLVAAAFGVPFDHAFHNDFTFDYQPTFETNNDPPKLFDRQPGPELAGNGAAYSVQCLKCGISGDFSIDGSLAFSIKNGITKGALQLTNKKPFNLDAVLGVKVTLQADKAVSKEEKKELGKIPLSPISIPGILILGPFISIAAELDVTLTGEASLIVGGSLSLAPGTATLDAVNKERNGIQGLAVKFKPVAQFEGSITATLALGLPVSIEVGLDLLNGKFKKSVGLVEKPLVYVDAKASKNQGAECKGVEISIGAKNQFYLSALDYYKYTIAENIIYEQSLGCITISGFEDDAKTKPDPGVFRSVVPPGKHDIIDKSKPVLRNVSKELKPAATKAGYRLITDKDQKHILVSGSDGHVYLVDSDEKYDLTAPWGTLELESKAFSLDVKERFMAAPSDVIHLITAAPIGMTESKRVPEGYRVMGLKTIKDGDRERVALAIHSEPDPKTKEVKLTLRYPTFCKSKTGTIMFSTRCIIGQDGAWKETDGKECASGKGHDLIIKNYSKHKLKIADPQKDCRTVQLAL